MNLLRTAWRAVKEFCGGVFVRFLMWALNYQGPGDAK